MTITPSLIYWMNFLDTLIAFEVCMILIAVFGMFVVADSLPDDKVGVGTFGWCFMWMIIWALALLFTPSSNTAYQMYLIPKLTNSQFVQKLPDDAQKLIDGMIKKYTEENTDK